MESSIEIFSEKTPIILSGTKDEVLNSIKEKIELLDKNAPNGIHSISICYIPSVIVTH